MSCTYRSPVTTPKGIYLDSRLGSELFEKLDFVKPFPDQRHNVWDIEFRLKEYKDNLSKDMETCNKLLSKATKQVERGYKKALSREKYIDGEHDITKVHPPMLVPGYLEKDKINPRHPKYEAEYVMAKVYYYAYSMRELIEVKEYMDLYCELAEKVLDADDPYNTDKERLAKEQLVTDVFDRLIITSKKLQVLSLEKLRLAREIVEGRKRTLHWCLLLIREWLYRD